MSGDIMDKVLLLRNIIRAIENQHTALMDTLHGELADAIKEANKDFSFQEIGVSMGISRQRVHQLVMRGEP